MIRYNKKAKNILKFLTPAGGFDAQWREGLPTGNGTIGLNILGGVGREVIIVNHTDLWWQGNTGVLPDVSDKVKKISKSLETLSYREAETTLTNALNAKNYKPECAYPLPVCDFIINNVIESTVSDYCRSINVESGEVCVTYKDKGVRFERNAFVSRANNCICYEISSSSKKVCCDFTISMHDKTNNRTANFENFDISLQGQTKTDKDFIVFTSRNDDGSDFGCVAKVICSGGVLTKTIDKFSVKNADRVLILAKVFVSNQKEVKIGELQEELSLIKMPYDKLLKEHTLIHSKLVNTTEINLISDCYENINEALLANRSQEMPLSLLEKMYTYGKHLFACSCGDKINPTGLFNGDYKAYRGTIENYLQLQRMFDFTFKANLSKLIIPVFNKFYDNLDDYKKNSTRLYGCKGIFIPSLESPESGLPGSTMPGVVMNFNVASYICSMIYQYYLQTDDIEFIKDKGYEIIEETGMFYEDLLKLNKNTNTLESPFGFSPFNTPSNVETKTDEMFCIASNCATDFVSAKFVFNCLIQLGVILNKEEKEIERWQKLLEKVPDMEVDKFGYLKEYNSNIFETNHSSPYIPHLFPYNIGFKPFESKKNFEELVANSVNVRFKNCFGKFNSANLCDMATALATCGNASDSYEVLSTMIRNFTTNNLIISSGDNLGMGVGEYESWTSFGIDKNLGLCTCLQNMFINSNKNNVSLFRNLPKVFGKGSVTNLILNNQIKADLDFNVKRGIVNLKLRSPKNTVINLNLPNGLKKVKGIEQTKVNMENLVIESLSLQANKSINLKIYFKNNV